MLNLKDHNNKTPMDSNQVWVLKHNGNAKGWNLKVYPVLMRGFIMGICAQTHSISIHRWVLFWTMIGQSLVTGISVARWSLDGTVHHSEKVVSQWDVLDYCESCGAILATASLISSLVQFSWVQVFGAKLPISTRRRDKLFILCQVVGTHCQSPPALSFSLFDALS